MNELNNTLILLTNEIIKIVILLFISVVFITYEILIIKEYRFELGFRNSLKLFFDKIKLKRILKDFKVKYQIKNNEFLVLIDRNVLNNKHDELNINSIFHYLNYKNSYYEKNNIIYKFNLINAVTKINKLSDVKFESNYLIFEENKIKYNHTLVSGITGSGKTMLLMFIITQILLNNDCITVIDPKRSNLTVFSTNKGIKTVDDSTNFLDIVKQFNNEIYERNIVIKEKLENNIDYEYSQHYKTKFLLIDELASVSAVLDKKDYIEFQNLLRNIANVGRASGMFLILATQQPNTTNISSELRNQMINKILIGNTNDIDYRMMFNNSFDKNVKLNLGQAYYLTSDMADTDILQTPLFKIKSLLR